MVRSSFWALLRDTSSIAMLVSALAVLSASRVEADLTCVAEVDRQQAAPQEDVVLTLRASCAGSQPPHHDPPVIHGADVVPGRTSQSFSMDAGGTRISVSAVYYVRSKGDEDISIPPIAFLSGQRRCTTEPITIRIDREAAVPVPRTNRQAGRTGESEYITLTVDRDEVWLGEQIVMTFRYHRVRSTWGQPSYTPPRTEGFWRVDMPPERNFRQASAGQTYEVTEIRYALFPTRAGDLVIEPARLSVAGDAFGRFFGRGGGPRQLETDPMVVKVKNWPAPQPPGFSGIAAGRLDLAADLDRREVPRGEPATLSLRILADAFLKSYEGLDVPEQSGLRLFESSQKIQENLSGPRYMSTFMQEKALVPLQEVELALPPVELVYFDTSDGGYRTVKAAVPVLRVLPSDLPTVGDDPSGFRRAEIARLGHDLAFIHSPSGPLRRQASPLVRQGVWWSVFLMPWFMLCIYRWWLRRRVLSRRDPARFRRQNAWARARKSLRRLRRQGGEPGDLAQAIFTYAADHLGRSAAGLTAAEIGAWCGAIGDEPVGRRLAEVLAACDQERFGGLGSVDVPAMAKEVLVLLAAVEKSLAADRRGRRDRSTLPVILLCSLGLLAGAGRGFGAGGAADESMRVVDPARLVAEANQAYTAGDLEAALRLYEEALHKGVDDAVLHYNIGNTRARRGELGRAIASYLRAQRIAPRDRDVRANLAWVRANTRDLELRGQELPPVIAQLDAAVHLLTLDEWAMALALLGWATALFTAWIWHRGWLSTGMRRLRLMLSALVVLAAVAVATRWYFEEGRDVAVVIHEEVAVRSGPDDSFPVVFRIHDGLTLEIRGVRDGWARIGLGGDWVGWVPSEDLERIVRRASPAADTWPCWSGSRRR
jgi:hypothetical protein